MILSYDSYLETLEESSKKENELEALIG